MNYQFSILSWILFLSAVIGLSITIAAWRRRTTQIAWYLFVLEFAVVIWVFAAAFEAAAITIPLKLLWTQISYLGVASVPFLYFLLALAYGHHNKYLIKNKIILMSIIPVLIFCCVLTNNWHHLFYTGISINSNNIGIYEHGVLFWVYTIYAYTLLIGGLIIFSRAILRFPTFYKSQIFVLIAGALFPFVGNIMYVFKLNPIQGLDWTPISFIISGSLLALGIFKFQLLDLIPIARHKLIETMEDCVLVIDTQERIADLNHAMEDILDVKHKDAVGQQVRDVMAQWKELLNHLDENTNVQTQLWLKIKETDRYYDLRITRLMDSQNKFSGKLVKLHDITEFKIAEKRLMESEERYRLVLEDQTEIISRFLSDGTYTFVNELFCRFFGKSREELIGHKWYPNAHLEDQEIIETKLKTMSLQEPVVDIENRVYSGKGELHWMQFINRGLYDEDGNLLEVQSVGRDITERKQAEEKLKKSEQEYRSLSEQLAKSNSMKEILLDVMSHDLKNPAGTILGFADLLLEKNPESEELEAMKQSSYNLLKVIDNANVLSKAAIGEEIEKENIDLNHMLNTVIDEFESRLKDLGIDIVKEFDESLQIKANPIIEAVFKNYISNAIKYAGDGKQIIIRERLGNGFVTIEVVDNGDTIPKEKRELIFERNVQLTKGKRRGRGLGLSIVKRIAEAHNAEVGVKPNTPTGNIFYIKIPVL